MISRLSLISVLVGLLSGCIEAPLERCDFKETAMCVAPLCVADCEGRICGDDGCGGSCGLCPKDNQCTEDGQCVACNHEALCLGSECGEDGCGQLCGICAEGSLCILGKCKEVCQPACMGRNCGPDGCGGFCGDCADGQVCGEDGHCVLAQPGCEVVFDTPGCPDCPEGVEKCICDLVPGCCSLGWISTCRQVGQMSCGLSCVDGPADCSVNQDYSAEAGIFRQCGSVGATGCGQCPPGSFCHGNGSCVFEIPDDVGRTCKSDGECISSICLDMDTSHRFCSSRCASSAQCPPAWFCDPNLNLEGWAGLCRPQEACWPDCQGRTCGPDGCGGTCGQCEDGFGCSPEGQCLAQGDGCVPTPGVPGCDGCSCMAEVCSQAPACCSSVWGGDCVTLCAASPDAACQNPDLDPLCLDGDCGCRVRSKPSCFGCSCQDCVCEKLPHCCTTRWDEFCVKQCSECGQICPGQPTNP